MQVDGTTYYYITNLQGDVVELVDASGNTVASYTYSPYGKVLTSEGTLADKNPLRYRGYYYDAESGLYYLQSRYYDPNTGRFINADSYASTGQGILGFNTYAYCKNNPIKHTDHLGRACVDATREYTMSGYCGGIIEVFGFTTWLINHLQLRSNNAKKGKRSDRIDWEAGDHTHIVKGTRLKKKGPSHVEGWRRFGIDPDHPDEAWEFLVPILKEVVDEAERIVERALPDGSLSIEFFKMFGSEGVEVMVKIWISEDGLRVQIADAIPTIIS